jgi:hypothetical protein
LRITPWCSSARKVPYLVLSARQRNTGRISGRRRVSVGRSTFSSMLTATLRPGLWLLCRLDFPLLGTLIGTYTGKIIALGGHIQIFVNNQLVVDFTDPDPIPFGGIGLGATWEVNAWFDNVSVTPEFSSIVTRLWPFFSKPEIGENGRQMRL